MKFIKDGIFQSERSKLKLNSNAIINDLKKSASRVERLRSRILYHTNLKSYPQHMFLCFDRKSKVPVSFHTFAESFTITEGVAHYRFYNSKGQPKHDIRLSPAYMNGTFYVLISPKTPHRFFSISKHVTANEIGFSHYSSEFTSYGKGNVFKKADKLTLKQLIQKPLIIKNDTKISKIKKNCFKISSKSGVAQLSFEIINDLLHKCNEPFYIYPCEKITKLRNKLIKTTEQIIVIPPKQKMSLKLSDGVIHLLKGSMNILCEKKIFRLNLKKNFSIGSFKNKSLDIKNNNSKVAIFHLVNESKK